MFSHGSAQHIVDNVDNWTEPRAAPSPSRSSAHGRKRQFFVWVRHGPIISRPGEQIKNRFRS